MWTTHQFLLENQNCRKLSLIESPTKFTTQTADCLRKANAKGVFIESNAGENLRKTT